jgi:hypothetical protein
MHKVSTVLVMTLLALDECSMTWQQGRPVPLRYSFKETQKAFERIWKKIWK